MECLHDGKNDDKKTPPCLKGALGSVPYIYWMIGCVLERVPITDAQCKPVFTEDHVHRYMRYLIDTDARIVRPYQRSNIVYNVLLQTVRPEYLTKTHLADLVVKVMGKLNDMFGHGSYVFDLRSVTSS